MDIASSLASADSGSPLAAAAIGDAELFRLLMKHLDGCSILLLDSDARIVASKSGSYPVTGYEEGGAAGEPYERFFTPEDRAAGKPHLLLREAERAGHVRDEGWRLRRDGTRFWATATLTALCQGDPAGVQGYAEIIHDATQEHAAEQVRQSEERFRLSVGALREQAFYLLSPTGIVEHWNAGAELIKGYTADEVVGKHFSIFFTPEDLAQGKPERELEIAKARGSYEEEGWRVRKDGSRFWAAVMLTAIYDHDGCLRGFAKLTRDETQRHEAHLVLGDSLTRSRFLERTLREHADELERRVEERTAQLLRQTDELTRANAELEQFAYLASHDLKEPLRMIGCYLGLLRLKQPALFQAPAGTYMAKIEAAATRMREMIDGVLEFTRLHAEEGASVEVPLREAVSYALGNVQTAVSEADARIHVGELPTVRGNMANLIRVFQNLIGNAVKYRSSRPLEIDIGAAASAHAWTISVRDNGIGIPPESHEEIFLIFKRLQGKRETNGSGIGLAACKKIIERHGGRIWVESTPGAGSTFFFTLPRTC